MTQRGQGEKQLKKDEERMKEKIAHSRNKSFEFPQNVRKNNR